MATPSTVDCVTPQEFHGISTDVTEMESSRARLNKRGSKPFLIYRLRKRLPPRIRERYWSPVQALRNNPLPTVAPTVCRSVWILLVNVVVIDPSMPVPVRVPPNSIAHNTREIVGSIPATPPVATRESRSELLVPIAVSVKRMSQHIIVKSFHEDVYPSDEMI